MTYDKIKPYLEKGLVSEQAHPEDSDVRIFNYTQVCQFEQAWDEVTRHCRGLIMNVKTGDVLARPFPKFFNYAEHISKNIPIPTETPLVCEKLDGSLGILYVLNGEPWIATRGSFTSDQARWATAWWRKNVGAKPLPNQTHLFEIIYPENRIVVNYDYSGLVHISTRETDTGKEVSYFWNGVRRPKMVEVSNLDELAKLDEPNSEGFVVYFPQANERLKIKFPEYVRLHKLVTGVSEIAIWEHLFEGKEFSDLLSKVPDEFFRWVQSVTERLLMEFHDIEADAELAVLSVAHMKTRREQAEWIMKNAKHLSGPIFFLLDDQVDRAEKAIWRMIRPKGKSQFKVDIDL